MSVEEPDQREKIIDLVAALKESIATRDSAARQPKRVRKVSRVKDAKATKKAASK